MSLMKRFCWKIILRHSVVIHNRTGRIIKGLADECKSWFWAHLIRMSHWFSHVSASWYEIRYCNSRFKVFKNFTGCPKISDEDIAGANLSEPVPAYDTEMAWWYAPLSVPKTGVLVFALRAYDDEGQASEVSNPAVASWKVMSSTTTDKTTQAPANTHSSNKFQLTLSLSVLFIVLFAIVILLTCQLWKRRKAQGKYTLPFVYSASQASIKKIDDVM